MTARLIDGKAFAQHFYDRLKKQVAWLKAHQRVVPGLAVVLIGQNPSSALYTKIKCQTAKKLGFSSSFHALPADVSEHQVLALLERLNRDDAVHGILIQLPLPEHLSVLSLLSTLNPLKDVDGFHPYNMGQLMIGGEGLFACTPLGCLALLQDYLKLSLAGQHAVILGRSLIVGRPLAQLLLQADCTVTVAHSHTQELSDLTRQADLVISAMGQPQTLTKKWIKKGAVVLDVGITQQGRSFVGDVVFDEVKTVASALTPVPGGVGPMTVAMLMTNTLKAYCLQRKISLSSLPT